jgi:hypothetical protein
VDCFRERLVVRLFPRLPDLLRVDFLDRELVFRLEDVELFLFATELSPRGAIIAQARQVPSIYFCSRIRARMEANDFLINWKKQK